MSSKRPLNLTLKLQKSRRAKQTSIFLLGILLLLFVWLLHTTNQSVLYIVVEGFLFCFLGCGVHQELNGKCYQYVHIQQPFHKLKREDSNEWLTIKVTGAIDLVQLLIVNFRVVAGEDDNGISNATAEGNSQGVKSGDALFIWRDAISESDFRYLKALIKTGALYPDVS